MPPGSRPSCSPPFGRVGTAIGCGRDYYIGHSGVPGREMGCLYNFVAKVGVIDLGLFVCFAIG